MPPAGVEKPPRGNSAHNVLLVLSFLIVSAAAAQPHDGWFGCFLFGPLPYVRRVS